MRQLKRVGKAELKLARLAQKEEEEGGAALAEADDEVAAATERLEALTQAEADVASLGAATKGKTTAVVPASLAATLNALGVGDQAPAPMARGPPKVKGPKASEVKQHL